MSHASGSRVADFPVSRAKATGLMLKMFVRNTKVRNCGMEGGLPPLHPRLQRFSRAGASRAVTRISARRSFRFPRYTGRTWVQASPPPPGETGKVRLYRRARAGFHVYSLAVTSKVMSTSAWIRLDEDSVTLLSLLPMLSLLLPPKAQHVGNRSGSQKPECQWHASLQHWHRSVN
jgi:hypothetical protein